MKNNKGITLVALVITIIVLLILAGVTIAALSGDNGILTRASSAKQENALGEAKDLVAMAINEATEAYYSTTYLNVTNTSVDTTSKLRTAIKYVEEKAIAKKSAGVTIKTTDKNAKEITGIIDQNGGLKWN